MDKNQLIQGFKNKLIVSCQALPHEPLFGSEVMAKMAVAAVAGGAVGIRANTPTDIMAIKKAVDVPVIGLYKVEYPDSDIYITPTLKEVEALVAAGADLLAFDCTDRLRPGGMTREAFVQEVKKAFPQLILMADISTAEEAKMAQTLGVDIISTTLSGYTPYSLQQEKPDLTLVKMLAEELTLPIIAEGRIASPEEMRQAFDSGAFAVIVGGAITRPLEITKRFVQALP